MDSQDRHGVSTFARRIGTGPRPALAVHCMLGSSSIWDPVLGPLGEQITATAFDLPGHGRSGAWEQDATAGSYQTLATRIAASFIDRPVDLIGHSFGSSVALRIAAAAPEAIRTLTLIEPVLFVAAPDGAERDHWQARQAEMDRMIVAGDTEQAARRFMHDWGAGTPWEALSARHRTRFAAQMRIVDNVGPANFSDPGRIWRPDAIEAIDAPVMIIHGADSPAIIRDVSEAIAARLGDVGIASVPGAGHMLPVTHAEALSALIGMNLERG